MHKDESQTLVTLAKIAEEAEQYDGTLSNNHLH